MDDTVDARDLEMFNRFYKVFLNGSFAVCTQTREREADLVIDMWRELDHIQQFILVTMVFDELIAAQMELYRLNNGQA